MKKSTIATLFVFFLAIPLTLYLGTKISGRAHFITGTLIMIELIIPFFMAYESKKPDARSLVLIAVMSAIAIASRFIIPIPHFKPIFAIIIISGIAFGPEAGFIIGAISALGSNFFLGQGAFTPWQMFAYGAGGMMAGFIFYKAKKIKPIILAVFGFVVNLIIIGPLLDLSGIFMFLSTISLSSAFAMLMGGATINLVQGSCTFITLLFLGGPLLKKLERIKLKYGIIHPPRSCEGRRRS